MAGINNLREIYEKKGDDFLNQLLNSYVIINERMDGAFFGVKKTKADAFKYFKKSGEISYVDRVLMKYYNPAISFFENIALPKRQRIPSNFYFGFQFFNRGDDNRSRQSLPNNGLILSYIHRLNDAGEIESTIQTKDQLERWAKYLEVDAPPIIFEGYLNDEQKTEILDFIYSKKEDLTKKFKTHSFTKYVLSLLGSNEDQDRDMEAIVFRFYDKEDEMREHAYLAKIVDPLFHNEKDQEVRPTTSSQDYIWLIVIDLMNHFEMYSTSDLQRIAQNGDSFEQKYMSIIDQVFKDFINEYSSKYEGLELEIPDYLKRPEFELDMSLIKDLEIISKIKNNETYREIYKILLNFFRRERKKTKANFFTPELLNQLNLIVQKIRRIIMKDEVYESLFPSFGEFIGAIDNGDVLSESEFAETVSKKNDPIPVNILIGSFQPVTNGHLKAAEKLKEANGNRCVFVALKGERTTKMSPFSAKITRSMLARTQQAHPDLIEDVILVPSGQIEEVLEALYPNYKPVLWGSSENKIKDYALQFEYVKKKKIPLRLSSDFKLVQVPEFVNSSEVFAAIQGSNFEEFKKLVPKSIVPDFFNLQKELSVNESEKSDVNSLNENFDKADIE
jgi:hypothetical protein